MRHFGLAFFLVLAFAAGAGPAAAESWRSQQPAGPGGTPALLGAIGDIEFQAPDRGMLITAGNGGVAPGLFAYDGSGWYRYSTVCGGHDGRIAWAGPREFWTISDQQVGQGTGLKPPEHISLCHFKDGQVLASYGEPVGAANSYHSLNAAACAGPSNCWFGGERLLPPATVNQGAFHLHWDGGAVTPTPSLVSASDLADPGRSVFGLAFHEDSPYESVTIRSDDAPTLEEAAAEAEFGPSVLHRIEPGTAHPFEFRPLFGAEAFSYGAEAEELQGFHLSDDGTRLWAVSGVKGGSPATVTVLRLDGDGLAQLPLEDPGAVFGPEASVSGAAAEVGLDDAWVAFSRGTDSLLTSPARLARVQGDGTIDPEVTLPAAGETVAGEELGSKGFAGPIACAAAQQCWMATSKGWLFHLGPDPAPNADPALHVLITSRPADDSLPVLPPLELPEDDSGAGSKKGTSDQEAIPGEFEKPPKRLPPLYSKVKQRLIHGTILEISFTLHEKAQVRLVARRQGQVVGKTKRYTLEKGRHSLRLRLDPKRWPTKLDFQAHPVKRGSR